MKRLLYTLVGLIIFLSIFFNFERITIGGQNLSGIQPFVYFLTSIAVILIIAVPFFRRMKIGVQLFIWAVVYFVLKIFIFNKLPFQFEQNIYLFFSELVLFLISVYLAERLSVTLDDLGKVVENALFPTANQRIFNMTRAQPIIESEFIRGRRYNYPITALVVEPNPGTGEWPNTADLNLAVQEIIQTLQTRYQYAKLAKVISDQTRQSDLIVDLDQEGRFIIICPETTAENSASLINRLQSATKENLGVSITYGLASFPEDALTYEAVIDKAKLKLTSGTDFLLQA